MNRNLILQLVLMVVFVAIAISALSLYNLRTIGIKSSLHNAQSIAEVIKSGLTSHMVNNNMNEVNTFVQSVANMKNVDKIWLVRGENVNQQFGTQKVNPVRDPMDTHVLKTGKMEYEIRESFTQSSVRISIPYNAVADKGINCLQCHTVEPGETLGAVSLVLDISTLKQIGIESIYIITLLILCAIIFIVLFSKRILNPYLKLYEKFKNNMTQATTGKFKKIVAPKGLSSDMKQLTDDYNNLMSTFKDTSIDIDKKLQGFVGYKTTIKTKNPLNESKEIIDNLSNLYQFKKQIELDSTKEEIYARVAQVFKNRFKIRNFTFIEIDMLKQKMNKVVEEGDSFQCAKTLQESPELCRAARTKSDVFSIEYHSSCQYFDCQNKFHYCINIDITKNLYLIINCVTDTLEELEELKDNIVFIKSYLKEAAPSLEVKLLMNALKDSAFRDGLTGLYNRKFLDEHSKKLIPQAKREKMNIGVLMLDMDHFKAVNDEYGHDIGDKVLKELARILSETMRESDLVIRYGGEEFVVLLVGVKSEEDAVLVAQKIGARVRENEIDVYAGSKLRKTVSIGLSMYPQDGSSIESVMKNADIALYEAKESGRDKVIRFTEEQRSSVELF